MGRSKGDAEQLLGNSGCCMKAARAGISLNNNYSYCLLSTYCLPKTAQSAFHASNLSVLPAALCGDGQTEDQRSQVTCPSSHNQSVAGQESNPASSDFIAWVSRNIARITDIPPYLCPVASPPTPPNPFPEQRVVLFTVVHSPIFTFCASLGSVAGSSHSPTYIPVYFPFLVMM